MTVRHDTSLIDFSDPRLSLSKLAKEIVDALQTVGFEKATKWFYSLPDSSKYALARKSFNPLNKNIYRGYFPANASNSSYKEGFEIAEELSQEEYSRIRFPLYEPNRWPSANEEETKWFKSVLCDYYLLMHNTAMNRTRTMN